MTLKQMLMLGSAAGGLCLAAPYANVDAQAFNATPKTVFGGVGYDRATPGVETITIDTESAIIAWTPTAGTFLPAGNTATFINGINNQNFAVLNRIVSATPVRFDGTVLGLLGDLAAGTAAPGGTVIFSTPGGIIVGSTAVFDVGNLILTSLNVTDDGAGNFGGQTGNYQFSPFLGVPGAAVVTEPGAQITALNQGSYVALVAPRVIHGGSVRVNGSIAYVAGEALELRVNNGLFDIIVTTGTDNATPLVHTGTTGGPSSVAADDVQRIYMVAVPKNQAITAILEGNVGFDPAVVAGVENGAIVLSAGHSVVAGNVDRFATASPPPVPVAASFHIRGGTVTSDLTGVAVTDMLASGQTTGSLTFEQDVSLFADRRAHLFAGPNQNVTVNGNALISAARLDSADKLLVDLTGGEALVFAQAGGSVQINGTTTVTAAAQGRSNAVGMVGSGTGGTAGIFADQGNVQLNGDVFVDATGNGAKPPPGSPVGGDGSGGTAFVEGRTGGTIQINGNLGVDASGTASQASGLLAVTGAIGRGGTIRLGTTGTAQVNVTGLANLATDGRGGAVLDGMGSMGGLGTGGDILVTQTGGAIALGGNATMSASGFGGPAPVGGMGQGGNIVFDVTGAQFQFNGAAVLAATGTGGDSGLVGGQGGDGQGGTVRLTARDGGAGARIAGGNLDVAVTGTGGQGGNFVIGTPAGDGGDGQGGEIALLAEAGNAVVEFSALAASANGRGGRGGSADNDIDGGDGGDGQGGNVQIGTVPTAAPTVTGYARFASVDLRANGLGGAGGLGQGAGGDATGGSATITAGGAPVLIPGTADLEANGRGGPGGVGAVAGVGPDGQGAGGRIVLSASGGAGALNAGSVNGTASATGAAAATNAPGQWHVNAGTGGAVNLANLNLTAAANGNAAVPAFSSLEPLGGTISVTGIANLVTPGEIRVLANGAGRISGGRYNLNAGTDVTMSHAAPIGGGFTIDAADLFVIAGDDFSADAGVVTRTSAQTDIRAADAATVVGRLLGANLLLRAASLDLAVTGAIGGAGTANADVQVIGNANVAGQIQGQAIIVRSAGLDVAGTIGGVGTVTSDVQATGNAKVTGQIQGQKILLRSAGLNLGAGGAIGGAGTTSVDAQATGDATIAGQIQAQNIILRSAGLDVAATGSIGTANTASADVRATGNVNLAGQIRGQAIVLRSAALNLAASGAVGGTETATADVQATGNADISGQLQGQAIVLRSAGLNVGTTGAVGGAGTNSTDILATGAATVSGQIRGANILLNAASLDLAAAGSIGGGAATNVSDVRTAGNAAIAGQITGRTVRITSAAINIAPTGTVGGAATNQAELRATGAIGIAGRLLGANILAASSDIDLPAGGAIGDAATQLVTLQPNATGQSATLGGAAQGPGYTLTGAEAGRIRAATLRISAPALAGGNALLIRDVTFNGGGGAAGIGTLEIATPGVTRVEGALLLANAAAGNGISINSAERIEVATPTGSIRVRDAGGAPGGSLSLTSANLWAASPAILDRLRANPNYAARDADLLDNGGNLAPRGFIEGNTVALTTSGTLFVQNSGPGMGTFLTGTDFGGITVGAGGLTIRSTATPATVTAFGRRLNADGTTTTGDDFFFGAAYQANGAPLAAGYTLGSALNTCIIVTGQCGLRAPPAAGPGGPDPTIGPFGGSDSILLPAGAEGDDLVDTSFAAEGLIEEPVTSGGDGSLWETDCDRDNDGDCDEGGR